MTIIRTSVIWGEMKIDLTPEEVREAYLFEQHENDLSDAKCMLADRFDINDDLERSQKFEKTFGFTFYEAIDPASPHYLLEKLTRRFRKAWAWNIAEYDLWYQLITNLIREQGGM